MEEPRSEDALAVVPEDAPPLTVVPPSTSIFIDGGEVNLPPGWVVEHRPRTGGKFKGKYEKFYYEPESHKQFRSLTSVERYLEKRAELEAILNGTDHGQPSNPTITELVVKEEEENDDGDDDDDDDDDDEKEEGEETERRRGLNQNAPKSITWCLNAVDQDDQDLWGPEANDPEKLRDDSNQVSSAGASGSE
ncbi:methyl-CPG-binding domain 6 [Euphorbia peplus]|nr:methyl-CPG-binding domain 6 [Euphorbia peplus]